MVCSKSVNRTPLYGHTNNIHAPRALPSNHVPSSSRSARASCARTRAILTATSSAATASSILSSSSSSCETRRTALSRGGEGAPAALHPGTDVGRPGDGCCMSMIKLRTVCTTASAPRSVLARATSDRLTKLGPPEALEDAVPREPCDDGGGVGVTARIVVGAAAIESFGFQVGP